MLPDGFMEIVIGLRKWGDNCLNFSQKIEAQNYLT